MSQATGTKYCRNCGHMVKGETAYCPSCGYNFATGAVPVSVQTEQTPPLQPQKAMNPKKMKLCKACGAPIAKNAKKCPHCGKQKVWPYIVSAIIIVIAIFAFIDILNDESEPQKVDDTTSQTQQGADETGGKNANEVDDNAAFTVGDRVELDDVIVTLHDVSESTGGTYSTAPDGKVFIVCEFEIENNTTGDVAVSSILSFSAYVDDYAAEYTLATLVSDKAQLDGTIAAGKKMRGVVAYEAPSDWSEVEVRFLPSFWSKEIIFTYTKP